MKKKSTLAVLGALAVAVPHADAGYYGTRLQAGSTYTFRINDAGFGNSSTLLSVTRGRLEVEEVRAAASAEFVEITFTVPPKASRIILAIDLQCPDTGTVVCGQVGLTLIDQVGNTVLPPVTVAGTDHAETVLDVEP
jgi:hypothetical protein